MTVLEVVGVEKSFDAAGGRLRVLDGVDLRVEPGEIVALVGRSGSGKTTLLTIVAGWERPDRGTVSLLGGAAPPDQHIPWATLALLPQSLGLLDELTVEENVELPIRLDGVHHPDDPDDPAALMWRLGIDHLADRFPSEISLGERQRAALARAVVGRPRLLLADEPVAHQNRSWAEAMIALLGDLTARGTACLLATHDEIAVGAASRVFELRDGQLSAHAPPRPAGR